MLLRPSIHGAVAHVLAQLKGDGAVHQWRTKQKTEWKGGKGQRGIFHLKALLSYRSSIKTEREEICENGFTKFPSLSMNSPLNIMKGGRCEMAARD